jgi:tetratricopeptide (TPR) repeat protein
MIQLKEMFETAEFEPEFCRAVVQRFYEQGQIDKVMMLSALHVIAASPQVRDYAEAARLAGEQEMVALEVRGPNLQANLASADRHRGVLAFIQGHFEVALDYFTRALERQRTAENLGNVLCALLSLGELAEARSIARQVRGTLSSAVVDELNQRIEQDPDLAVLRTEAR